jgi:DNA-damage-inducible protein J
MAQTTLNVRIDEDVKRELEAFCDAVGMNISVAVNMFAKTVIREQRLPFEIAAHPFYGEANQKRLKEAVGRLEAGKGVEHELFEVDEDA